MPRTVLYALVEGSVADGSRAQLIGTGAGKGPFSSPINPSDTGAEVPSFALTGANG